MMQPKVEGHVATQLWKFVTANNDADLLIQNYSRVSGGLTIDCKNGSSVGQVPHLWSRNDGNDNQKFYMTIQ